MQALACIVHKVSPRKSPNENLDHRKRNDLDIRKSREKLCTVASPDKLPRTRNHHAELETAEL